MELVILLVIVMLLFGASRLPKLARSLGQSSKEFRKGMSEGAQDEDSPGSPGSPG
jgi:sec-independent protein translocase protein TatA